MLPKFRGRSPRGFARAWTVWVLWTPGVGWHWLVVVYTWHWRQAVIGFGLLELAAYAKTLWDLFAPGRAGRRGEKSLPEAPGSWLEIFGFLGFELTLAANLTLSLRVAHGGASRHAMTVGFVALLIFAVGPRLLPASAFIELSAVLLFALNLALALAHPLPAWFIEEGLRTDLPLYFYVTDFPKTQRLLTREGLKTLAAARRVPLSLTLD